MKAPPFAYAKPKSLAEAFELIERPGARILAGGQSLIPSLNMRLASPELLVDITGLNDLRKKHAPAYEKKGARLTLTSFALQAVAAECASEQGRFWEYHDVLFENHEHLERESLFRYARELGLELATFRSCLDDPATRARVGQDVDVGNRVGIDSTPTLFFNGRKVSGALDRTHYEYALIIEKERREAHTARGGS